MSNRTPLPLPNNEYITILSVDQLKSAKKASRKAILRHFAKSFSIVGFVCDGSTPCGDFFLMR